ncbi:SGNH/GDSL hydrolase family protein [Leifsonia sp. AG29]|uniref:SGNH/GDSL hydrolase family protein n=1 Tax=Leifsonia sp. AG29 TaxID=2598860 RepID=UPI00131D1D67|nr:SGNH/GDSL hydrolase family protein [Leifsonia sp. AG29]
MFSRRSLAAAATAMTVAVVALTALSGCSTMPAPLAGATGASGSGSVQRVAVIGDSIEAGLGLDPEEAWPALVADQRGWQLANLSVSGAGFVATGASGADFSAQVDAAVADKAQLVFIGASDNDLGQSESTVSAAIRRQVDRLHSALPHAQLVGFNALSGQASDDDLAADNAALASAVEAVGGSWMDLGQPYRDQAGLVQDDGEHPTLPGQQAIADTVQTWLDQNQDALAAG